MAGTRKRNPEVMKKISSFVEEYFFEYHQSPSMQKIATAIGTSKSTAWKNFTCVNLCKLISNKK